MRLLADENVHRLVVAHLRDAGYDVEWVKETTAGARDHDLLARGDIGGLVLVTNDRDFGELVFRDRLPAPHAILYTRVPHLEWRLAADLLIALLERGVPAQQITTITKDGVRSRPFPTGEDNG